MEKNIKDYLKYYLGCEVKGSEGTMIYTLNKIGVNGFASFKDKNGFDMFLGDGWKPILRKLESMTEDECLELQRLSPFFIEGTDERYIKNRLHVIKDGMLAFRNLLPERFHYLLSNGFDLFGLIESGLAIEKQPTTQNQGV